MKNNSKLSDSDKVLHTRFQNDNLVEKVISDYSNLACAPQDTAYLTLQEIEGLNRVGSNNHLKILKDVDKMVRELMQALETESAKACKIGKLHEE